MTTQPSDDLRAIDCGLYELAVPPTSRRQPVAEGPQGLAVFVDPQRALVVSTYRWRQPLVGGLGVEATVGAALEHRAPAEFDVLIDDDDRRVVTARPDGLGATATIIGQRLQDGDVAVVEVVRPFGADDEVEALAAAVVASVRPC